MPKPDGTIGTGNVNFEIRIQRYPGYLNHLGDFQGTPNVASPHLKLANWTVSLLGDLDRQNFYETWHEDQYPLITTEMEHQIPGSTYDAQSVPNINSLECPSDVNNVSELRGANSYCAMVGMWPGGGITFAKGMKSANGVIANRFPPTDSALVCKQHSSPYASFTRKLRCNSDRIRDGLSNTAMSTENLQAESWHRVSFGNGRELLPSNVESQLNPKISRLLSGVVWEWLDDNGANAVPLPGRSVKINGSDIFNDSLGTTSVAVEDLAHPSTAHRGGVVMSFADGHTRFVSESIVYRTYQALLTPHGKNSDVPDPRFVISDGSF